MKIQALAFHVQYNPVRGLVVWMWALAAVLLVLMPFVWVFRQRTGGKALILLLLAMVIWNFFSGMEYISPDIAQKVFWMRFTYIGVSVVPTCSLLVSRIFRGDNRELSRLLKSLMILVPVVTILAAFTNSYHGLMWRSIGPNIVNNIPEWNYGIWFYVWLAFSNLILAGSLVTVIRAVVTQQGNYRAQAIGMMIAMLPPWIVNLLFILHVDMGALNYYYSTPVSSGISAVLIVGNLLIFHYLQQVPIARTQVLDSMNQGVLVLDERYVILDANPAICAMFNLTRREILGKNLTTDFPSMQKYIDDAFTVLDDELVSSTEFFLAQIGYLRVNISPVDRRGVQEPGWVILVDDISERKLAEQALVNAHHQLQVKVAELEQAQNTIKTIGELVPICAWCGRKIHQEDGTWVEVDKFIEEHSQAAMTHGICPDCLEKF